DPARNAFRQNIDGGNVHDAPDLVVRDLGVSYCGNGSGADVSFFVENIGATWVGTGVRIRLHVIPSGGAPFDLPAMHVSRSLEPGEGEAFSTTFDTRMAPHGFQLRVTVDWEPGNERGRYNECDETNNEVTVFGLDRCLGPV